MNEKQLIKNLKKLNTIKPAKEWGFSVKQEIIGEPETGFSFDFILRHKPAFASITLFFFIAVLSVYSYTALPGDVLFSVRKTSERIELTARLERAQEIIIAQRRLEDLKRSQERAIQNMEPAIQEMNTSMAKAAKVALENSDRTTTYQIIDIDKEIQSLGVIVENQDIVELYKREAGIEIDRLKEVSLTEEQAEQLEQAIELYDNEQYSEAFEIVLNIGY